MTEAEFVKRFGRKPVQDDLDRASCNKVGEVGHYMCGVCPRCDKLRFECGHYLINGSAKAEMRAKMLATFPDEQQAEVRFTCDSCTASEDCNEAFDPYNIDGDCLAGK